MRADLANQTLFFPQSCILPTSPTIQHTVEINRIDFGYFRPI
uniref:Uncharacterized protein n=1 Tax=Anguilla anguilla TaxID=7936 RepID=A0A0E9VYU5_ANGAN